MLILLTSLLVCQSATAKTYKIATVSPDGLGWMKKMRAGVKRINKLTEGRVKIKIYPGGVQGDDYTVLRKMRIGQLHGGVITASSLTRYYPDLQIYNLPLQFRNSEEVDYVRDRMDERIINGLYDNGMVSFNLFETGFAYLMTQSPVRSVRDLQNVKAWVPDGDPISAKLMQSFGVSPIPLPIVDVLAGLQTGLIDAVIVPPNAALALQWHNQVSYVTNLPLVYIYSMMAMDKKSFNSMTTEDQAVVRKVLNGVFSQVDADNRVENIDAYKALLTQGIKEVEPDLNKMEVWQSQAEQSVENLVRDGSLTQESLDLLRKYLAAVRSTVADQTGE